MSLLIDEIKVVGARIHNLKDLNVNIPYNRGVRLRKIQSSI